MADWTRRNRTHDLRSVRPAIKFKMDPQFARTLDSFAAAYGIRNMAGTMQWPEAMRFLIVSAILAKSEPQVRAAKAVHIAIKMLVMTIGPSLARAVDTEGYRRGQHIQVQPRSTSTVLGVTLDAWMRRQLNHPDILKHYFDGQGHVLDAKLITDLAIAALSDPLLDQTARMYQRWMEPMRAAIFQLDGQVRGAMRALIASLASTDTRLPDALAIGGGAEAQEGAA